MKQVMASAHLEQAEQHVAEGERHIALQREIVAGLKRRRGQWDTLRIAQELLQTLELAQQTHIADRDRLRAELDQFKSRKAHEHSRHSS
jgi:hypothetical protein